MSVPKRLAPTFIMQLTGREERKKGVAGDIASPNRVQMLPPRTRIWGLVDK